MYANMQMNMSAYIHTTYVTAKISGSKNAWAWLSMVLYLKK